MMSSIAIIVTFFMTWWLVLFTILPLFKPAPPKDIEMGHATSAPEFLHLRKKFAITTLISIIITLMLYISFEYQLITLDDFTYR